MIDNPRLELVLANHGRSVAIALVVIGILALIVTGWAVASPETATVTQTAEESAASEVRTSATVVDGSSLWEADEQLSDSPVYVLDASPELVVEPETKLTNETARTPIDGGEVTHRLTLQFEASRGDDTFWTETHEEINTTATTEDGVARSSTTIDVESYLERQRYLEEEVGNVGSIGLRMILEVEYDTGTHTGTHTDSTTLQLTEEAYWLEEPLSDSSEPPHSHTVGTQEISEPRSPALIAVLSLVGTLSLAGGVLIFRRAPTDVESARRSVHERRYAEWISRGSIPMWIGDHHIALDTLEDVVDVAIDANERVVHDRQRGLFAVVNGDVVYYYSERGLWEQTTWPAMNLAEGETATTPGQVSPSNEISEFDEPDGFDEEGEPDFDDEDVWDQV
ncbi:DUF5305 domain-containing protein [Natrarchaeobius chitinivorans]|uniref:DUF5305 domain-containing protein n=1 Tax=Natrarchaeobius chitinivorans TaxID=1679083 RepID=A0A3N6LQZ0_NATCH|nr:DUF5305 domain-containing protein [Natrarchaeobius chitinivorans]RQG92093.1 hypothetical protein EA473_17720 [Natrarchaeobius chitinivorans]